MSDNYFKTGLENLKKIDGTAGGCEAQLQVHINAALHVGIKEEKIIEAFLHCIPYTGFPKVLNAVAVAGQIFSGK